MKIRSLSVHLPYRYLWLKHVDGVDLSQHCARCLTGVYSRVVRRDRLEYGAIDLPDGYLAHYLCGVINWADNLHCAMVPRAGAVTEVHDGKCDLVLEDGVLVPISEDYIPDGFPNSCFRSFRTCRNWQFAHWLNANMAK